jgi:mono/diheme cytochrome c family protein
MMRSTQVLFPLMISLLAAGCIDMHDNNRDPIEVSERYAFRYDETCSSWLTSSKTGYKYCASPEVVVEVADMMAGSAEPEADSTEGLPADKENLMRIGAKKYASVCAACHQADGNGLPGSFPPLAGAGEFYGDAQNQARIIVHGLSGAITVKGQEYNSSMPGQGGQLNDYEIAAVATYVRNSWGNDDGLVMPEDVAAVR